MVKTKDDWPQVRDSAELLLLKFFMVAEEIAHPYPNFLARLFLSQRDLYYC
jgi:hypothetical protein